MESAFIIVVVLVTLGITAASILGAKKLISGMLSPLLAQQAETKRLLAVGIPCAARVLHIDQTGTSVAMMGEQSYELRFQLEVTPPAVAAYRGGMGPYRAEMVSLVSMLVIPRVQPGSVITVRCDPQDPRKMVFESADAPGQTPAYPSAPAAYAHAAPMGGYGGQPQGYGAPVPGHAGPVQGYGAQAQGYGAPARGYSSAPHGYGQTQAPGMPAAPQGGVGVPGGWKQN